MRLQYQLYLLALILTFLCSLISYRSLDQAAKLICLLLGVTLVSEAMGYYAAVYWHNSLFVYHIFNPLQLFILSMYFNSCIPAFRKHRIGYIIGGAGIAAGILNSWLLQPVNSLNSYYLLFEGLCVMGMCLHLFLTIIRNEQLQALRYLHFWISFIFLFFWSITYMNWALYWSTAQRMFYIIPFISTLLWLVNIVTYLSLGILFLLHTQKVFYRGK